MIIYHGLKFRASDGNPPNAPSPYGNKKIHPVSEVDLVVNLYMNYE